LRAADNAWTMLAATMRVTMKGGLHARILKKSMSAGVAL
jgi:hypothetical protein